MRMDIKCRYYTTLIHSNLNQRKKEKHRFYSLFMGKVVR